MAIKEDLFELLKIYPTTKNAIKTIVDQIPKEKLKLLEINLKDKKLSFKEHMILCYGHMYPICLLTSIKAKTLLIIENNKRLKVDKKFDFNELKKFIEEFKDLFDIRKPSTIWGKIFIFLGSSISGIISFGIGRLFFKKS